MGLFWKMLVSLIWLVVVPMVSAENLYVTPTGSGSQDGSSWSNAFNKFSGVAWGASPHQLGAGDTLWVAGGTYNESVKLKGSGESKNYINIKRARSSDIECTSSSGWNTGYDSQVVISPGSGAWGFWAESSSQSGPGHYLVIDGRITDGIRINLIQTPGMSAGIRIYGQGVFSSTFRYIGIYGPSTNAIKPEIKWDYEVKGINIQAMPSRGGWGRNDVYPSDITFEFCTISGLVTAIFGAYHQRITYQYNNIHTIECLVGEPHANIAWWSRVFDNVFRYNEVHDCMFAVGLFFTADGDEGVRSRNIYIYGNVFRDSTQPADRAIEIRQDNTNCGPLFIYNNTFVNMNQGINVLELLFSGAQSYIRNNLFVSTAKGTINLNYPSDPHLTVDNNILRGNYSLFKSQGNTGILPLPYEWQFVRNLDLTRATSPSGIALSSPYDADVMGRARGSDGAWDIGAYEFPTVRPSQNRINIH
jgi:hypothetical protein